MCIRCEEERELTMQNLYRRQINNKKNFLHAQEGEVVIRSNGSNSDYIEREEFERSLEELRKLIKHLSNCMQSLEDIDV